MKMKKLMSSVLAVVTVFTMSVPAFAADIAPSSEVAGITTYNTPYTTYLDAGDRDPVNLAVMGMTAAYGPAGMDIDQAKSVTWEVTASTVDGITKGYKYPNPNVKKTEDSGYISSVDVDVSKVPGSQSGYAVVQAKYPSVNPNLGTIDFAIVFNPSSITVAKNVKCTFDAGDGTKVLDTTLTEVGESTLTDTAKYPNALEATDMAAAAIKEITGIEISDGYLSSITINGKEYPNGYGTGTKSWTYRVYDENNKLVEESATLGAGLLQIKTGYTVKWSYTLYEG